MGDPSLLLQMADLSSDEEEDGLSHIPAALRGHLKVQEAAAPPTPPQEVDVGVRSVPDMFTQGRPREKEKPKDEVTVEGYSGLRVKGRDVDLELLGDDFGFESLGSVVKHADSLMKNNNFFTVGVVVMKSGTERSKNGNKYMKFRLHDLDSNSVLLMAFDSAYEALWKIDIGATLAIIKPTMLPPNGGGQGGAINVAMTSSQSSFIRCLGRSADLGFCKGTKRAGGTCDAPVNTNKGTGYCMYHLSQAKASANRALGKAQGAAAPSPPPKTNPFPTYHASNKDITRSISLAPSNRPTPVPASSLSPTPTPTGVTGASAPKKPATPVRPTPTAPSQSQRDKLLLSQLGTVKVPQEKQRTDAPAAGRRPPKFPGCLAPIEELRAFETQYNAWVKQVAAPQASAHVAAASTASGVKRAREVKKAPAPKKPVERVMVNKAKEKDEQYEMMAERRREVQERDAKRRKLAADSCKDLKSVLQPKETLAAARRKMQAPPPAPIIGKVQGSAPPSAALGATSKFQEQFANASTKADLPEHLKKAADIEVFERTDELLGALERKGQIIEEMSNVKETKVGAYRCLKCNTFYMKKENACSMAGHPMRWFDGITKKFWECSGCHQRRTTLGHTTLPQGGCNCSRSKWEAAGMQRADRQTSLLKMSATGEDDYYMNPYG